MTSNGPWLREFLGIDHVVGAERGHLVAQVGVADRGGDVRAGRGAELDRRGADAAGAAVNEQALARISGRTG